MDPNDRMNAESKLQNGARNRGDGGWGRTFARFRCRHRSNRCHPMPVSMGHSGLAAKSDADVESKPARHMSLTRCLFRSGCAQRERTRRLKMKVGHARKEKEKTGKVDLRVCATDCVRGGQKFKCGDCATRPAPMSELEWGTHPAAIRKKKPQTRANSDVEIEKKKTFPATLLARCNNGSLGWTKVTVKNMHCWSHRRRRFSRPSIFANRQSGKWILFQVATCSSER